jgi:Sec-independent protein secretion pathway component TatC
MQQIGPTELLLMMLLLVPLLLVFGGVYLVSRIWHRGRRDAERAAQRRH